MQRWEEKPWFGIQGEDAFGLMRELCARLGSSYLCGCDFGHSFLLLWLAIAAGAL